MEEPTSVRWERSCRGGEDAGQRKADSRLESLAVLAHLLYTQDGRTETRACGHSHLAPGVLHVPGSTRACPRRTRTKRKADRARVAFVLARRVARPECDDATPGCLDRWWRCLMSAHGYPSGRSGLAVSVVTREEERVMLARVWTRFLRSPRAPKYLVRLSASKLRPSTVEKVEDAPWWVLEAMSPAAPTFRPTRFKARGRRA